MGLDKDEKEVKMSESVRLLKGIMKTSGWTQEQVAEKLGVSFQTMNAWINGRSRPRRAMLERIRMLYLAQDITRDTEPTFITVFDKDGGLEVGDALLLKKDGIRIKVYKMGLDADSRTYVLNARIASLEDDAVKGTSALELVYGRFDRNARAKALFIYKGVVIARVVEWDYAEEGD